MMANWNNATMTTKNTKQAVVKAWDLFSRAPVDIIIPFYGQYEHLTSLIESIYSKTAYPYDITVVDDCSPNSNYGERLAEVPTEFGHIKVIRNEKQIGFGASINKGIEATDNTWVLIMHSDVMIRHTGWLNALGKTLVGLRDAKVKMVSAMMNDASGHKFLERPENVARDVIVGDSPVRGHIIKDNAYLPLVCSMFHRELVNKVGPFKEYKYGWYEDLEFAYRMQNEGYMQGQSGKCWVYHKGGATINKMCMSESVRAVLEKNKDLCIADIKSLKKTGMNV